MRRTEAPPQLNPSGTTARQQPAGRPTTVRPTKLQETCGRLAEIAQELGPEAKLPTVLQLRDRLGVSVATLNAALSELEAQRLIRRKHGVGIYVSPRIQQRNVVLLCDPSFFRAPGASPFWNLLVDQVRRRAAEGNEAISLHFAVDSLDRPQPQSGVELLNDGLADELAAGRIDGVLGVGLPLPVADWMERQNVPMVAFAGPGLCMVGIKASEYSRLGVAALARQGSRRIALWTVSSPFRPHGLYGPRASVSDPQLGIFEEALRAHGREFDPALVRDSRSLVVPGSYHTESHQEQGFRKAQEVFGPGTDPATWPDGIISTDDMLTQGALTALHKLGMRIGEDVRIATHANVGSPALLGWEEELTLMEIDPAEIVSLMFAQLEACMDGDVPVDRNRQVRPRLRDSTIAAAP